MALEIDGKVSRVLPEISGQGQNGTWKKQSFVIETLGEYPKKICFTTWGDRTDTVKTLNEGDRVSVSFRLESREYNERWYTDAVAWKLQKLVNPGATTQAPANEEVTKTEDAPVLPENKEEDDLPF